MPPDRPTEEEERVLENRRIDRSIDRCLYGSLVKEFSFVSLIKILYEYEVAFIQTAQHFIWLPDAEILPSTEYYMIHLRRPPRVDIANPRKNSSKKQRFQKYRNKQLLQLLTNVYK